MSRLPDKLGDVKLYPAEGIATSSIQWSHPVINNDGQMVIVGMVYEAGLCRLCVRECSGIRRRNSDWWFSCDFLAALNGTGLKPWAENIINKQG